MLMIRWAPPIILSTPCFPLVDMIFNGILINSSTNAFAYAGSAMRLRSLHKRGWVTTRVQRTCSLYSLFLRHEAGSTNKSNTSAENANDRHEVLVKCTDLALRSCKIDRIGHVHLVISQESHVEHSQPWNQTEENCDAVFCETEPMMLQCLRESCYFTHVN